MKRKIGLLSLILVMVLASTAAVFASDGNVPLLTTTAAGGLEITEVIPKDGEGGKQLNNMAVKVKFNQPMTNTENDRVNHDSIVVQSADGKVITHTLYHHEKYPNELWLILDKDLVSNTEYTVHVFPGIVSDNGAVLASGQTTTFKTRNMKTDSTINTVLMIGMIAVMAFATSQSTKKAASERGETNTKIESDVATNPYKRAKAQGISVEEARAQIAKEKEKEAARNKSKVKAIEKKKEIDAEYEAEVEKRALEIYEKNVFHVHDRGSLVGHGHKIPKPVQKKLARYKKNNRK